MSQLVDTLLNNAYQDTQLLISNDAQGDNFDMPRDIDFLFYAPNAKKGELVASFINDNNYGVATYYENAEAHCIRVIVNMPSTQHLVCSVSALMSCIAKLFDIEYDGWGCKLQIATDASS